MQIQKRRIKPEKDLDKADIGLTVSIGNYSYVVIADRVFDFPRPIGEFEIARRDLEKFSILVEAQPTPPPKTK